jgi:hypothetical protein
MLQKVKELKEKGEWPKRFKPCKFTKDPFLVQVRMHNSVTFPHTRNLERKNDAQCVLCSTRNAKRHTKSWCLICDVPLCLKPMEGKSTKSCFCQWHAVKDLRRESVNRKLQLKKQEQGTKHKTAKGHGHGHR